ncbi:MAG: helix-turn-helix transcriptional regulator [Pseudomonadota bacterium]
MSEKEKYQYREIGARLRAIRESTGMNTKEFAAFLELNYTRYVNWETGARRLLPDQAEIFCDRFSVTLDFIYRGKLAQLPENILKAVASIPRESAQSTSNESPD